MERKDIEPDMWNNNRHIVFDSSYSLLTCDYIYTDLFVILIDKNNLYKAKSYIKIVFPDVLSWILKKKDVQQSSKKENGISIINNSSLLDKISAESVLSCNIDDCCHIRLNTDLHIMDVIVRKEDCFILEGKKYKL